MAAGLKVGPIFYKIGTGDFLNSFFSTVVYNLENSKRGSRFPCLMRDIYQGRLLWNDIQLAEKELKIIKSELMLYLPDKVVWDIDDLSKRPPWGDNIADRITDLSNYFYTSDSENLFDLFTKALNTGKEVKKDIIIFSI